MSYKILLADDSVTVQKIVTLTFSDEGVDVIPVNNGDDAIKRLQSLRPALVMADVSIPGRNGYEICAYVKSHPELRHIPVILLVPAFEPFDEERASRAGADNHLTKPFQSIRTLIATVKGLIEPDAQPQPIEAPAWPATDGAAPAQESLTDFLRGVFAQDDLETTDTKEPDTGDLLAEVIDTIATPSSAQVADEAARDTAKVNMPGAATPILVGSAPTSFASVWDDDVLELDDVLPAVTPPVTAITAAPIVTLAPATNLSGSITQSLKLTSVEAVTTIPPSVIDEIVNRVAAQVTAQITQQLNQQFNQFAARLAQDVIAQFSPAQNLRANPLPSPPIVKRDPSDSLLDL